MKILLALTMALALLALTPVPALAQATATRTLPDAAVGVGAQFEVGIDADGFGSFGQVVETLPDGLTYVDGSATAVSGIAEDTVAEAVDGQNVTFTFLCASPISFTYNVTAPDTAGGPFYFAGVLDGATADVDPITGDTAVNVEGATATMAPTMSNISASAISETTADISWRTNEASTSQVEYWTSPSKLSPLDETMTYSHLVHLTGLTPGTTYHYKTMSKDAAGNVAVSDEDTFTTLGKPPAAIFTTSNLSISPGEVDIGGSVTISAMVTNTGAVAGSYEVTLKLNGVTEATKELTLDAGASKEVTFTTSKDKAATYSVAVNGLSGSFTVKEKVAPAPAPAPPAPPEVKAPINWPLIGGIIAGVVIVGLIVFFLVRRRAY